VFLFGVLSVSDILEQAIVLFSREIIIICPFELFAQTAIVIVIIHSLVHCPRVVDCHFLKFKDVPRFSLLDLRYCIKITKPIISKLILHAFYSVRNRVALNLI